MDKITEEIHNEMKQVIADKTKCMIESYSGVLAETKKSLEAELGSMIKDDEIMKRADMFWNIALQKMDKEKALAQNSQMMPQQGMPQGMMPQGQRGMPPEMMQGQESPCAKKAREAAAKIATLEAEVLESKKEPETK